jgi:hypothetical protein
MPSNKESAIAGQRMKMRKSARERERERERAEASEIHPIMGLLALRTRTISLLPNECDVTRLSYKK